MGILDFLFGSKKRREQKRENRKLEKQQPVLGSYPVFTNRLYDINPLYIAENDTYSREEEKSNDVEFGGGGFGGGGAGGTWNDDSTNDHHDSHDQGSNNDYDAGGDSSGGDGGSD